MTPSDDQPKLVVNSGNRLGRDLIRPVSGSDIRKCSLPWNRWCLALSVTRSGHCAWLCVPSPDAPLVVMSMSNASSSPAGHAGVPVHQLEAIIAALTQVAGQLEAAACDLDAASQPRSTAPVRAEHEKLVEAELLATFCKGNEGFAALAIAEGLRAVLSDDGHQLSAAQVRRMLPPMMLRLFGSKLSCSVKGENGRYVRGYRSLKFHPALTAATKSP